jgi:rhomboid protease GluP
MAERREHTWVTYWLIVANVAMFVFECVAGAHPTDPTPQQLLDVGANFAPLTTHGEWWRLGTAMFLHFGMLHIGFNMVCLWQGRVVETLFGRGPFAVIYLLAGLVGGVASIARNSFVVSAGASGAVFGVYGAFGAYLVLRRSTMPEDVWHRTARGIGIFLAINFVFGMTAPNIDMTAHIGGLAVGFVTGMALLGRGRARPSARRTLAVAGIGLALTAASTFAIPRTTDVAPLLARFEIVESACIAKWNDLGKRDRAGELTDAQTAVELERDVLGPWRAMRAELDAVDNVPTRLQPMVGAIKKYIASRQESWETFAASLRATGDDKQTKLDLHHRQELAVEHDANALRDEIKKLQIDHD